MGAEWESVMVSVGALELRTYLVVGIPGRYGTNHLTKGGKVWRIFHPSQGEVWMDGRFSTPSQVWLGG